MELSRDQIDAFQRDGYLILPSLFSRAEVDVLRDALEAPFAEDCPQNFREKGKGLTWRRASRRRQRRAPDLSEFRIEEDTQRTGRVVLRLGDARAVGVFEMKLAAKGQPAKQAQAR